MEILKNKILAKADGQANKRTIENLVVFLIILIATILFINYIWNGNKKNEKKENNPIVLAESNTLPTSNATSEGNTLEEQLEDILKNLDGVGDAKVLITYSETNKVVPMYNEDNQQSVTQEEDVQGRGKNN